MYISDVDACVKYLHLSTLIPKLNEHGVLSSEEERNVASAALKPRERTVNMLWFVVKKMNGWKMFLSALKSETSHSGHAALLEVLKVLPPVEGT